MVDLYHWQLDGSAPELYERYLVPAITSKWADDLTVRAQPGAENATTEIQISTLMDVWLLLYNRESNGEHNRQLYLLKSRGMAHSNQVREFVMSSDGIRLRTAYVGPEGVLTGSARLVQEAKDEAATLIREQEMERRSRALEHRRREIAAQIEILQAQLASEEAECLFSSAKPSRARINWPPTVVAMEVSRQAGARANAGAPKPSNKPKKGLDSE